MPSNDHYVYALLNPIRHHEIFYIGKGKNRRVFKHYEPATLKRNSHKNNIIKQYRSIGLKDSFYIIAKDLTNEEAIFQEIYWISFFGRASTNEGVLTNNTDGGEDPPVAYGRMNNRAIAKANGTLSSLKYKKTVSKIVQEGMWHSSKANNKRVISGTHNFQGIFPWKSCRNTELSRQTWLQADCIYNCYKNNPSLGCIRLKSKYELESNCQISRKTIQTILTKIKIGWIPSQDVEWVSFKQTFKE